MNIEKLHISFKSIVSETQRDLKSYASYFCAERGYYVEDLKLIFDGAALMPGVRVAFRPVLHYDEQGLTELRAALEEDLNNVVFDCAYNVRHKISAEDSNPVTSIPHICEYMPQLVAALQN